ncbi:MAG: hypothetical protein KDB00_20285 [Planctomycetales bacterium]|nr:hypothetical protein [Planctomycetales bacterium]
MRLPVILVQNPPAAGAALAEALVGNLIGRAGLDLTLVDRFDSIADDSTDRMTLEGITVPSAILDWRSEEQILESLEAIGFTGVRCPHQLDSDHSPTPGTSTRRLFLFDLTKHQDATKIVSELDRLRGSLSVKTVSLGSLSPINGAKNAVTKGDQTPSDQPQNSASRTDSVASSAADSTAVPGRSGAAAMTYLASPRSDKNLDDLIDQLDDLDV